MGTLVVQEAAKGMGDMNTTMNDLFGFLTGSIWYELDTYQMEYGVGHGNGMDCGYGMGYGDGLGYNDMGVDEGAMTGCGDSYGYIFNWF